MTGTIIIRSACVSIPHWIVIYSRQQIVSDYSKRLIVTFPHLEKNCALIVAIMSSNVVIWKWWTNEMKPNWFNQIFEASAQTVCFQSASFTLDGIHCPLWDQRPNVSSINWCSHPLFGSWHALPLLYGTLALGHSSLPIFAHSLKTVRDLLEHANTTLHEHFVQQIKPMSLFHCTK